MPAKDKRSLTEATIPLHGPLLRGKRRPRVALIGRFGAGKSTIFEAASSPVARHEKLAGVGDEEQFRIGADRLFVGGRSLDAGDGGALMRGRQGNGHEFDAGLTGGTGKRGAATGLQGDDPRALRAAEHGLHALAIVPTRDGGLAVCGADAGGVRVDAAAEALCGAGEHAVHARGGGREDDRGGGGLHQ